MNGFWNLIIICSLIYLCFTIFFNGENNSFNISDLVHNTLIVEVDNSVKKYDFNYYQNNNNTITTSTPITK